MKSYSLFLSILVALLISLTSTSCKKKSKEEEKADFDRKAMLTNIGNNIIIPNYKTLNVACNKLDSAIIDFKAGPDNTKLLNLQTIFKDAYRAWQFCSPLNFGPSDQENLKGDLNIFPTDTVKINANINVDSLSYNLDALSNADAKGFPAIDFLLFGTGSDILAKFTSDSRAAYRKKYLANLSSQIKTKVGNVLNAWLPSGGNYINTFINADGTDMGSSVGLLVNSLNHDLDDIKNFKISLPLGKQTAGVLYPGKVEAYYSGISAELIVLQIKTMESIFLGKSSLGDGIGFDDYLDQIDAQYNGGSLSSAIKNQFTSAIAKLELLSDPLSSDIQTNTAAVDAAYVEVQKLLVLLKTDMPSALGVLITYVENDGD